MVSLPCRTRGIDTSKAASVAAGLRHPPSFGSNQPGERLCLAVGRIGFPIPSKLNG